MSDFPEIFNSRVVEARAAVNSNAIHHLEAGYRYQIYALIHHADQIVPGKILPRWTYKRSRLAYAHLLSVRKVASLWYKKDTERQRFDRLLYYAEGLMHQKVGRKEAETYYWENFDWFSEQEVQLQAADRYEDWKAALDTFVSALLTVAWAANGAEDAYLLEEDQRMLTEGDTHFTSQGGVYFACQGYAGSIWEPTSDAQKRREFWMWWLDECVPHVWQVITGHETASFDFCEQFTSLPSLSK